ncbi:MAG: hypothetical protein KJ907_00445 [Actinobacteria bacterium]|nr:hypothetical protein [Actinomycetota bacterium]MBU4391379.1 hypothetical protein [Actinomycetota bacterium]MBU4401193.1 hypothetical protein [Actinomycetota bacterium]MBU4441136.1 hypothetical protein [Actinomycetota bacterium]
MGRSTNLEGGFSTSPLGRLEMMPARCRRYGEKAGGRQECRPSRWVAVSNPLLHLAEALKEVIDIA